MYLIRTDKMVRGYADYETERSGEFKNMPAKGFTYTIYNPETYNRFIAKAVQLKIETHVEMKGVDKKDKM